MPTFPFEVSLDVIFQDPEGYVDAVFSCLESEFLVLPKGAGFITRQIHSDSLRRGAPQPAGDLRHWVSRL
jgi:hypothetical protein